LWKETTKTEREPDGITTYTYDGAYRSLQYWGTWLDRREMQAAKGKYEGEQKTANSTSMELGGDIDFPYDINLEGINAKDHEGNSFAIGEL